MKRLNYLIFMFMMVSPAFLSAQTATVGSKVGPVKICDPSNEPVELPYDEVKSVFCTKNLIAVRSKASLVYMLQKSGFTLGAADGFLDFMHEKGLYKKR